MTTWTATANVVEWTSTEDPSVVFRFVAAATVEAGDSLPDIEEGDAGKALVVNEEEDGVEWGDVEVSEEDIASAVEAYLTENPPEGGTAPIVVQGIIDSDTDLSGGSFTMVDLVTPDGSALNSIPRAFVAGFRVAAMDGDDAGVWTITESGPATPVDVLGGQTVQWVFEGTDPDSAVILVGSNASGPNGTVDPASAATSLKLPASATTGWGDITGKPSTFPPELPIGWDDVSGKPHFTRQTAIFSRLHFGGDDGTAQLIDTDTGEVLAPLYDASYVSENGELYLLDEDGEPTGSPFDVADPPAPIISGAPYAGGTVYTEDQPEWEANGPWDPVYDADEESPTFGSWVATRPAALNGWITDDMAVEGMPVWIGSGKYRNTKWAYGYNGIVPGLGARLQPDAITIEGLEGTTAEDGAVLVRDSEHWRGRRWRPLVPSDIVGLDTDGAVSVIGGQGIGTLHDGTALAAEVSLLNSTFTLPAFTEGDLLFFQAWVTLLNNSGGGRTYTFRVKIGATTAATFVSANTGGSSAPRNLLLIFSARVTAGSDLQGGLASVCSLTSLLGAAPAMAAEAVSEAGLSFDLTAQSEVSTATQEARLRSIYVWKVKA